MNQLWGVTYARSSGIYDHPYGVFDPLKSYMYIDRCCYRVPDSISNLFGKGKRTLQRSLTPHLDCCPQRLFESSKEHPKWRPIQAFIALTDSIDKNQGGFEACLGLHKRFDEWTTNRKPNHNTAGEEVPPPCVGEFTPIRPKEDLDVISQFQHIPCKAGDLVCWDYRIPHANARKNETTAPREVVYIGLLPCVPINKAYAEYQLDRFRQGLVPEDQWHEHLTLQPNDYTFSALGRKMMGIDLWK